MPILCRLKDQYRLKLGLGRVDHSRRSIESCECQTEPLSRPCRIGFRKPTIVVVNAVRCVVDSVVVIVIVAIVVSPILLLLRHALSLSLCRSRRSSPRGKRCELIRVHGTRTGSIWCNKRTILWMFTVHSECVKMRRKGLWTIIISEIAVCLFVCTRRQRHYSIEKVLNRNLWAIC